MTKKAPKLTHVGGKFYSVETKHGTFIGTKEKASLYAKGKHDPQFRQVVSDGELVAQ